MPKIRCAWICVAALGVVTACTSASGGGSTPPVAASGVPTGSAAASSADLASSPPPETSGTEPAGPAAGSDPALTVASLPIGVNADGEGCVTIRFLRSASEVPAGLRLVVTGVLFDPPPRTGGSGCAGSRVWCLDRPVLTDSTGDECFVRVVGSPDGDTMTKVQVTAMVDCPAGRQEDCRAFEQQLTDDAVSEGPTTVTVPAAPAPASDSSTDTSTHTSTDSSTDTSTP